MPKRVSRSGRSVRTARRLTPTELAREIERLRAELAPALPDVDPGDLILILQAVLRPFGTGRRYFLRKRPTGGYVF